jgi:hypothetical protein
MPSPRLVPLVLSDAERASLEALVRGPVLPPGDPGHPPQRHPPQVGAVPGTGGRGQRGHCVTSVDSASVAGPHQAARR